MVNKQQALLFLLKLCTADEQYLKVMSIKPDSYNFVLLVFSSNCFKGTLHTMAGLAGFCQLMPVKLFDLWHFS